jgi:hypothetical protein
MSSKAQDLLRRVDDVQRQVLNLIAAVVYSLVCLHAIPRLAGWCGAR